ncbi:MAG: sensor histidine kinase [Clostridia bacterium]|nr:sensor histidine kinase [Clostridia bacterium]
MKNKQKANSKSVLWRIHGNLLGEIFFCFLLCDLLVAWGLFPKELLALPGQSFHPEQLPEIIENIPTSVYIEILQTMRPMFGVQAIYFVYSLFFGSVKLHKILQPLTRITETAQALSHETLDDEVFHQLESAVSRIDPLAVGQQLHTGNSELAGLESAVNSLLERMRQSYRQQTRFVSDASHELRTPIAVIQGYVSMLDRWGKEDPAILDESITAIKSESEHMQHLVEQLLFLARSDSGRNPLTISEVCLNDMLAETCQEYQMINRNHHWQLYLPENPICLQADPTMLKQALRILCDNAAKYSSQNTTITLRLQQKENAAAFSVQDEGIGISPDDQAHIFERFYRADPSRVRQTGGTGLGLSIAHWIITRHGGTIEVLSRDDLGTRMTVILPL